MLKTKKKNTDPTPCIDPTPKHRSHLQPQKILWYGLLCHCTHALQTTEKWERTKCKVKAHVSKTKKMFKRKRAVKNLPVHDKKEEKDVWAIFYVMKAGNGKDKTNTNLQLFFLFPKSVPLFMRVPLHWSVGWGRSNSIGGADIGGAIKA